MGSKKRVSPLSSRHCSSSSTHQAHEVRQRRVRHLERRGRGARGEHTRQTAVGPDGVLPFLPAPAGGIADSGLLLLWICGGYGRDADGPPP